MTIYLLPSAPSFWSSVWPSVVGGIIAGLVVALTVGRIQRIRTPLLQLTQVAGDKAILKYNGWIFPIELGKNWEMGEGTILSTPSRKGALEGDRMSPGEEKVVRIDYPPNRDQRITLTLGGTVSLTYRIRLSSRITGPTNIDSYPDPFSMEKHRFPRFWTWRDYQLVLKA